MTQTATPAIEATQDVIPAWGEDYCNGRVAYVVPDSGAYVWMYRKGQKVRFYDTNAVQVGPEHKNVAPAEYWTAANAWIDPFAPLLSLACITEVRSQLAARRMEALARQEKAS